MQRREIRTRYDITRVHSVFVLDKAEAIHELDLGNLTGAMGVEVVLNIGLGSYNSHGPVSEAIHASRNLHEGIAQQPSLLASSDSKGIPAFHRPISASP